MNSRNSHPIHGASRSSVQRALRICLCLIVVMAIGLCCLSVYTVSTVKDQRQKLTQAEASLAERDKTIAKLKKELKDKAVVSQPSDNAPVPANPTTPVKPTTPAKPIKPTQPAKPPVSSTEKMVALTFDDGPGPYTDRLLDELKKRNVKATFFVLGNSVTQYPDALKRMAQEGHEIGNHSNSHKNLLRLNAAQVHAELNPCADKVEKIIGRRPTLIRCPYGNSNAHVKAYAKKENVPLIYWSVDTRDWEYKNKPDPVSLIMKEAFDGKYPIQNSSIVLMHDIHSTSVDAAVKMMDRLIQEGYKLVTVSELLHARIGEVEAGETYTGRE